MGEGADIKQTGVEVTLDKKRHLIFDLNDMCDMEEKYGDITKALEATKNMKGSREILWVALKHEDSKITEKQAGELVLMPRFNEISSKLREALWGSMPKPKNEPAEETEKKK